MKDKKSLIIIVLCLFAIIFGDRFLHKPKPETSTENIGEIQIEEPTPNEEILNLTLETPAFQIGDTILYLNKATLQDFVNAGGELELGYGFTHLDSMMEHGEERVGVKYKNAKFLVDLVNNTGSEIPVKNSIINSIREVNDKNIIVSSGIMIGDTFNSIMEKTNNGLQEFSHYDLLNKNSRLHLIYIYKDFIVVFNKESLMLEEFTLQPSKPKPNYLSDLNQITENSWDKIKELYFNTDLSKIDTFYTDKINPIGGTEYLKTEKNKYTSLRNITPKKALLGIRNEDNPNYGAPYNVLIIEAIGDISFTDADFSESTLKSLERYSFNNPYVGAYTYCFIDNLIVSEQGDINFANYDKFTEVSTNAYMLEKSIKSHAVSHLNQEPVLDNYIWYELELNW